MELIGDTFHQNVQRTKTNIDICQEILVYVSMCIFFCSQWPAMRLKESKSKAFIYLLKVWYSSCIIEPTRKKHTRTQTKLSEIHIHFVSLRQKNPYEELHSHMRRMEIPIKIVLRQNTNWWIHTNSDDCFRLNNHFNRFDPNTFRRMFACEFFTASYFHCAVIFNIFVSLPRISMQVDVLFSIRHIVFVSNEYFNGFFFKRNMEILSHRLTMFIERKTCVCAQRKSVLQYSHFLRLSPSHHDNIHRYHMRISDT